MDRTDSELMTPEEVTTGDFGSRLRGADPARVTAHLDRVADTVRRLLAESEQLRAELADLREQADEAAAGGSGLDELDDEQLAERLGDENARLVAQARESAATIRSEAEEDAASILAQAEQLYAERSHLADVEAGRIRSEMVSLRDAQLAEIEDELASARRRAESELESVRQASSAERQEAEAEADRLVAEAQHVRRQILEDLARRRSTARRQIEQLRAGRDRLIGAHEVVRRALDDISDELRVSMSDARAAAETAGLSVSESTVEELEAEIETARLSGLLDTGPLPVVERSEPGRGSQSQEPPEADDQVDEGDSEPEESANSTSTETTAEAGGSAADSGAQAGSEPATPAADEGRDLANVFDIGSARNGGADAPADAAGTSEPAGPARPADMVGVSEHVDTGSHPAARGMTADRSIDETTSAELDDPTADQRVEDIFARMRSNREKAGAGARPDSREEPASSEKSDPEVPTKRKKSGGGKGGKSKKSEVPGLSTKELEALVRDLSRRLKRVLADEQSEVLSTVRSASNAPSADELLGPADLHKARYWDVASEVVAGASVGAADIESIRPEIDSMVTALRSRASKAVDDAADLDAMVDQLRAVYREVKTRRIGEHSEALCAAAAELGARGKDAS